MNKETFDALAARLDTVYDSVFLDCDGYLVWASRQPVGKTRLAIGVYVDGWIKGNWTHADADGNFAPEALRFWRRRARAYWTQEERRTWIKIFGKKGAEQRGILDESVTYDALWPSSRAFLRHVIKQNQAVEVLDLAEYERRLGAKRSAA